jgi:hypothetical protein
MNKILFIIAFSFTTQFLLAQEGKWKICVNKKTLLEAVREDEAKNVKTISLKEWKKSGNLEVIFTETEKDIWFYRHIAIFDKDDNEIYRKDSTNTIKIALQQLKKLTTGKKQLFIYTTISPKDPNVAIRIRRVHLCTLKLP